MHRYSGLLAVLIGALVLAAGRPPPVLGAAHRINARDFGGKGDGITDDTAALNAAAAAGAAAGPGTVLFIPSGRYLMLTPKGGAHLHVQGADGLTVQGE